MDAQAVAKELKVRAVLTGRVTQRADGLSISVELINAQDNSQIWGQQYNRKLTDVFAVQEEIVRGISDKLRLQPTIAERQQLAKRPYCTPRVPVSFHYGHEGASAFMRVPCRVAQTGIVKQLFTEASQICNCPLPTKLSFPVRW